MKFLGFCLSMLPLPVIQQAGQALDRHFSDDVLRKKLEKLWSDVSAANAKVASLSRLEEAIVEIADTLQQHEEILRDAKKFSELLKEADSTFTIQTEGRSYQQIVNSVIQAGRVLIAATDGSVNVIEGTQVHIPHTRLHASGGSKNYVDGTAFQGSEGSVEMQGISTQGNIHVSGSSIGFSNGSSLTFGGNPTNYRDLRIADAGVAHPMWVHEGERRAEPVEERRLGRSSAPGQSSPAEAPHQERPRNRPG